MSFSAVQGNARQRTVGHRGIVGEFGLAIFADFAHDGIGAGAASFGAADEEIAAGHGDYRGIPLGRNETDGPCRFARGGMRKVKDGDRIRDGVGGEQRFLVSGKSERFGIAAAKHLVREFGGECEEYFCGGRVEHIDFVAVGECDEKARIIARKQKSGGMRAAFESASRLAQRDEAADCAGLQIEFGDRGSIPEGDEAALAVGSHDGGVGQRGRDAFKGGKIEAANDFAVGDIQENGFIGTVGSDEKALDTVVLRDAEASGVGDILELSGAQFSERKFGARRERKKAFGSHFTVMKRVDGDSVSRASLPLAEWIGERGHGCVEMLAVETER